MQRGELSIRFYSPENPFLFSHKATKATKGKFKKIERLYKNIIILFLLGVYLKIT